MKKWIYSGTREEQPSERELMHGKLAKKAASEGIVLLKNEGILPLKKDTAAALLGYGAEKTVKGGIGSGEDVPANILTAPKRIRSVCLRQ